MKKVQDFWLVTEVMKSNHNKRAPMVATKKQNKIWKQFGLVRAFHATPQTKYA